MREIGWSEWGIGLIGVWLLVTPCLLALSPNEALWGQGQILNLGLAALAMAALAIRALSTRSKQGEPEGYR